MSPFITDITHAAKRLRRQPGFAVISALTLAVGLGANLTLFGFVNAVLLSPIASPSPHELIRVMHQRPGGGADIVSYLNYRDLRDNLRGVALAAHQQVPVEVGDGDATAMRTAELVTGNYFSVLQLAPTLGRLIDARDEKAELASPVVVLSDSYWRRAFGADSRIVGRRLTINGAAFEVIGVAPARFHGTLHAHPVDLWVPVMMQQIARPRGLTLDRRGWGWLQMIGRMTPPRTLAAIDADLARVARDLDDRFPTGGAATVFTAHPALAVSDADRTTLTPLLTATYAFTALLFVVTCANLGGLMHARLAARRRDMAIKQSLGAGRSRLTWEWFAEAALIAFAGAALGLVTARLASAVIVSLDVPPSLAGTVRLTPPSTWTIAWYAAALAAFAAALVGGWPAWRAGRVDASAFLKSDSVTTLGAQHRTRGRRTAVIAQVALSVVMLVSAGVLANAVRDRSAVSPGFPSERLGLLPVSLERKRVPEAEWRALADQALRVVRADPSVIAADLAFRAPLAPGADQLGFRVPGYVGPDGSDRVTIDFNVVGANYFETLGISFVAGRTWDRAAAARTPHAVVNETLADQLLPGVDAVGRVIEISGGSMVTVAGVVRDSAYYDVGEPKLPYIYLSAENQMPSPWVLHVRTRDDLAHTLPRLARALTSVDARLTPFDVMSFEDLRAVPLFPARTLAWVALAFGAAALALTAIGLYGIVAASVEGRRREIGLRLALGARRSAVIGGVLGEAGAMAAAGAALGFGGGWIASTALQTWLLGSTSSDVGVFLAVGAVLGAVTLAAAWLPARRASRTDVGQVLRG